MSDFEHIPALKSAMRREARTLRAALCDDLRAQAGIALRDLVGDLVGSPPLPIHGPVAGYWPLAEEMDTRPLLHHLVKRGHIVGLPVTGPKRTPLIFRRWTPDQPLFGGRHGTLIPSADQPEITPAVVLLPLLAFDRQGGRLGYGGGYYDRTLGLLRAQGPVTAIGVAFSTQEVDRVPTGPFDRPLDWVVTEREAIPVVATDQC